MKKIQLVEIDPDDLRKMIREELMQVHSSMPVVETAMVDNRVLNKQTICGVLGIEASAFEKYKEDLRRCGMFQLGGPNTPYRMKRSDLDKFIEQRKKHY